jgi:hypothetical protein
MPFDMTPVETKPDVFSLEGLIVWLEKQPEQMEYDWGRPGWCLIAKYLRAAGLDVVSVNVPGTCALVNERNPEMTEQMADVAVGRPWTYGAALTRARALLGDRG